jgi:hypothetical protein
VLRLMRCLDGCALALCSIAFGKELAGLRLSALCSHSETCRRASRSFVPTAQIRRMRKPCALRAAPAPSSAHKPGQPARHVRLPAL